jgi:hypothetical protein
MHALLMNSAAHLWDVHRVIVPIHAFMQAHATTQQQRPPPLCSSSPGLVKALRRCVRDMAGKAGGFVEQCVKAERDMQQEVNWHCPLLPLHSVVLAAPSRSWVFADSRTHAH